MISHVSSKFKSGGFGVHGKDLTPLAFSYRGETGGLIWWFPQITCRCSFLTPFATLTSPPMPKTGHRLPPCSRHWIHPKLGSAVNNKDTLTFQLFLPLSNRLYLSSDIFVSPGAPFDTTWANMSLIMCRQLHLYIMHYCSNVNTTAWHASRSPRFGSKKPLGRPIRIVKGTADSLTGGDTVTGSPKSHGHEAAIAATGLRQPQPQGTSPSLRHIFWPYFILARAPCTWSSVRNLSK